MDFRLALHKFDLIKNLCVHLLVLKKYNEILLIGSGKGVASVKEIKKIGWKRKNLSQYKIFSKYYRSAIKKCLIYKF